MHFQRKGGYHPSYSVTLTAYPTPGEGYNHNVFFLQNDGEGWDNDYLDPLSGEFRRFSTGP